MEFRSLKRQYEKNKDKIDDAVLSVIEGAQFIAGPQIKELESRLAEYVGVKHCITCANGTDALLLALMAWGIGQGDAVFVPDFTFFSSGEVVSAVGATPVFVDVDYDTFNIDSVKLEQEINRILEDEKCKPRIIIAVDLFGQPADYPKLRAIADKYDLLILEDGAQSFGGSIGNDKSCSFGDISTTSFFPMKPLGCYGDGGAVFTNNDEWAELIRSYCVHGKGSMKYDNVRIGMNSRLDTIQAAVLLAKFDVFVEKELMDISKVADRYNELLNGGNLSIHLKTPIVRDGFFSSWAQYTVKLDKNENRNDLQNYLKTRGIPTFIYYPKPMHMQKAFCYENLQNNDTRMTERLCEIVLSLPISPYITCNEMEYVANQIIAFFDNGDRHNSLSCVSLR